MARDQVPSTGVTAAVGPGQVSPADLATILARHVQWLESKGTAGTRAFCGPLNLVGANLCNARLERADFAEVDLRCADLSGASLSDARGLVAERLGGATLTDVDLPPALAGFETLRIAEELSRSSRSLVIALLMACAYCWLTIGTTLDAKLLANSVRSSLPIIQTDVPITAFFWVVPIALLAASTYIQLHLLKFWRALASLPAVFPNGMRLDERVYPWLLSSIAERRLATRRRALPRFAQLEAMLAEFVTWWFVPVTIAACWLRYLSRHDALGTALHVVVLVLAVVVSLVVRDAAYAELERRDAPPRRRASLAGGAAVASVAAAFSIVAIGTPHFGVYGVSFFPDLRGAQLSGENLRGVDMTHAHAAGAVLDGADLRAARLTGVPLERSNLKGAKLEEATLDGAKLNHADLRDASLQGASLRGTILQGVRFSAETSVDGARLEGADLRNVNLLEVPLAGSHIDRTTRLDRESLRGADASKGHFHAMVFDGLDIRRANLRSAQLEGAVFRNVRAGSKTRFDGANMRRATFECTSVPPPPTTAADEPAPVRRFKNSHFDFAKLQDATFGPCLMARSIFEGAALHRATFRGTVLTGAEFTEAALDHARFLDGVDLDGATFEGARLVGADLRGARGLAASSLKGACGDAATQLPPHLTGHALPVCPPD